MKNKAAGDKAGSLADASLHAVSQLLNKKKKRPQKEKTVAAGAAGVCGAPSRVNPDDEDAEADADGDDWEDIDVEGVDDGDDEQQADETERRLFHIRIDEPDEEAPAPKQRRKSALRAATAGDRAFAEAVHRTHLLCLLGRALLVDAAARDDVLQAALLSLLPEKLLAGGLGPLRPEHHTLILADLIVWFGHAFRRDDAAHVSEGTVAAKLAAAAVARCGSPEELAGVFAAACRACGLAARTVHAFVPSPLKPTEHLLEMSLGFGADTSEWPPLRSGKRVRAWCEKAMMLLAKHESGAGAATSRADPTPKARLSFHMAGSGMASSGHKQPQKQDQQQEWEKATGNTSGNDAFIVISDSDGDVDVEAMARAGAFGGSPGAAPSISPGAVLGGVEGVAPMGGKGRGTKGKAPEAAAVGPQAAAAKPSAGRGRKRAVSAPATTAAAADGAVADGSGPNRQKSKAEEEFERELQMAILATAPGDSGGPIAAVAPSRASSFPMQNAAGAGRGKGHGRGGRGRGAGGGGAAAAGDVSATADALADAPAAKRRKSGGRGGGGAAAASGGPGPVRHWVEVFCGTPSDGRWVAVLPGHPCPAAVDPQRRALASEIDVTSRCEAATAAAAIAGQQQQQQRSVAPVPYVVGCFGGGAKDLTRRYASIFSASVQLRTDEWWWDQTLKPLADREQAAFAAADTSCGVTAPGAAPGAPLDSAADEQQQPLAGPSTEAAAAAERRAAGASAGPSSPSPAAAAAAAAAAARKENDELRTRELSEGLPKRVSDYKKHNLYCLERFLLKYQVVHPKTVVGMFDGAAVYPRSSVQEVHTQGRWIRNHRRKVRDSELSKPIKVVPKSIKKSAAAAAAAAAAGADGTGEPEDDDDDGGGAGGGVAGPGKMALYGLWQTAEYEQAGAQDGKVPKNNYGNVEMLNKALAPPGCTHLTGYPRIWQAAKALNVDFAPAVVGFERHGGRMCPTIEGVVVAEEHAAAVVARYIEDAERRNAKEIAKRKAEGRTRWRSLISAIVLRKRLAATYDSAGAGAGAVGGATGGAAAAGASPPAKPKAGAKAARLIASATGEAAAPKPAGPRRGALGALSSAGTAAVGAAAERPPAGTGASGAAAAAGGVRPHSRSAAAAGAGAESPVVDLTDDLSDDADGAAATAAGTGGGAGDMPRRGQAARNISGGGESTGGGLQRLTSADVEEM